MNKLRLMRRLNDDEQFDGISCEGLHLFLLMIAGSSESGEGKLLLSRISEIFDQNLSFHKITVICEELKKKDFISVTYGHVRLNENEDILVIYQILHT